MAGFLLDTSCIVAAICSWHVDHEDAAAEIEKRLNGGEPMSVAAAALVESYAVLTRLPPPHRMSAQDAFALINANYMAGTKIVVLDARSYRKLLQEAPLDGIVGGRTYDAVIAFCALNAAATLLTFNEPHFRSFREKGLEVVVPGHG